MIKIYKDYSEFSQREDKTMNGVSQRFLDKYGLTLNTINLINCTGCWNCYDCKDCTNCRDCEDCTDCSENN